MLSILTHLAHSSFNVFYYNFEVTHHNTCTHIITVNICLNALCIQISHINSFFFSTYMNIYANNM